MLRNAVRFLAFIGATIAVALAAAVLVHEPVAAQTSTSRPSSATGGEAPWPRAISGDGYEILVYQPQIDRWEGDRIEGRAAVSVEKEATPEPTLGVIWLTARTSIDRASGLVSLDNLQVARASFPSAPANADEYLAAIRARVPAGTRTLSLERLKASLAVSDAEKQAVKTNPVRNDAPRIIYSSTPALLVLVDGEPVLRQVPGAKLLRAINTRALIVLDQGSGNYYLRALGRWMQAPKLDGPWIVTQNPPAALAIALKNAGSQTNLLDEPGPDIAEAAKQGVMPAIYVSATPAELVQSTGQAEYAPIPGTELLYVRNMSSNVLIDTKTQDYYVLISGRWFRTKSLADGKWEYVANDALPADFAKIPENHPKGDVLASVSGTPQAQEALIDNEIPQTAAVDRKKATVKISYDGGPEWKQIDGTSLQYAVNTPTPVIRAGDGRYYAVDNGVWFTAASPSGPWTVADEIPNEIYSIPPASPVHNVTYVRVYDSTPDYVYVGYTPGYYGTVVAPGGVVVYGTGYYYPGWAGAYWYPWLPTYGYGAGFAWGAVTGFTIGAINNAVWHGGPWRWDRDVNINNNFDFDHNNIYNRWDRDTVRARVDGRNGDRFDRDRFDRARSDRDRVADRDGKIGDRDGRPGQKEGRAVADRPDRDGKGDRSRDAARDKGKSIGDKGKSGDRSKSAAAKTKDRPQHQAAHKDLYAGKDGNVYRRDADGWQKHDGQKFAHAGDMNRDIRHLDQSQIARHHGDARHVARGGGGGMPRNASFHGGGRGGGGFHGGGGRGGGRRR